MRIFKKFKPYPLPDECKGLKIKVLTSTCTGEKIIGFYDPKTKKLLYSQLVKNESDIDDFYVKYGIERIK